MGKSWLTVLRTVWKTFDRFFFELRDFDIQRKASLLKFTRQWGPTLKVKFDSVVQPLRSKHKSRKLEFEPKNIRILQCNGEPKLYRNLSWGQSYSLIAQLEWDYSVSEIHTKSTLLVRLNSFGW